MQLDDFNKVVAMSFGFLRVYWQCCVMFESRSLYLQEITKLIPKVKLKTQSTGSHSSEQ